MFSFYPTDYPSAYSYYERLARDFAGRSLPVTARPQEPLSARPVPPTPRKTMGYTLVLYRTEIKPGRKRWLSKLAGLVGHRLRHLHRNVALALG